MDVYSTLAVHQRSEAWTHRELLSVLQLWCVRLIEEFKLNIPEVAIRVDTLRPTCYGHFRYGHNGFGLKGEIGINSSYIGDRDLWEVLGTLLHELLHAWQQAHGAPSARSNFHNAEFRQKAASLGLVIDTRGVTLYAPDGPFKQLLRQHGVAVPTSEPPTRERRRGNSKLKKWSCGCTNVRCAVADLHAQCLKCAQDFRRAE
jgi:hypothetical protein